MITENLSTLKIHKLTKEQYERELSAGRIDENALYLTPDEDSMDLSDYATKEYVDEAIASIEIPENGETVEQVQTDWNESDENSKAFIKNKPEVATEEEIIDILIQEDLLPAIIDINGAILADENNNILLW